MRGTEYASKELLGICLKIKIALFWVWIPILHSIMYMKLRRFYFEAHEARKHLKQKCFRAYFLNTCFKNIRSRSGENYNMETFKNNKKTESNLVIVIFLCVAIYRRALDSDHASYFTLG